MSSSFKSLLFFFSILFLIISCTNSNNGSYVGQIDFEPKIDTSYFELCNAADVEQYYIRKGKKSPAQFKGGIEELKNSIKDQCSLLDKSREQYYITVRFIVNCKGKVGRFRFNALSENLKYIDIDTSNFTCIQRSIEKLEKWIPVHDKKTKYDFYQYFCIKIVNGKIDEIMP